ncbi:hypothetical protein OH77DRAFT_1422202 [Trametes cingulata]|nr:hypothetical protein OH77DRAFT_1422202 [Trametes cingulata]
MASQQQAGKWSSGKPVPILTPARTAAQASSGRKSGAFNPFSNRMSDTLSRGPRTNSAFDSPSGTSSAQRAMAGGGGRSTANGYVVHPERPAKRQKTDNSKSKYFEGGGAGIGKGKGKAPAQPRAGFNQSEAEIILDSDEDVGVPVTSKSPEKQDEKASTPDPLDCLTGTDDHEHPFSAPSPKLKGKNRLPPDGPDTSRLRARHAAANVEPEIVNVDALSDDIESASGFDDEDARAHKVATPNGRQEIAPGTVKQKVSIFENNKDPPPLRKAPQRPPIPTLDLKQQQSVKSQMKPRNPKASASLSQFNHLPIEDLDPIATAPSGFKPKPREKKLEIPQDLPLESLALGCEILGDSDSMNPEYWVSVQAVANRGTHQLKIVRSQGGRKSPIADFRLDSAFDEFEYTDLTAAQKSDAIVVIQLQSTATAKLTGRPAYQAGSRRPTGKVTLRLRQWHANCNGQGYRQLVDILKKEMRCAGVLDHHASTSCWEAVVLAAKHKAGEVERNTSRSTRSNASPSAGPSSISAGPSNSSSTTVVPSGEETSASAPPRTYGTERRVTRQSARGARTSVTPENLDELVLVYPPSGTGAVNITRGDLKRLDNGQYLNDTLIEFGLKVWLDELRKDQPELAEQVHIFNSFFFKKLNSKKEVRDSYPSVRKWTSKVDIFKKKYIIVPINENFHWYLAIIVNPENILHPPPPQARGSAPQTRKRKRDEKPPTSTAATAPEEAPSESRSDTTPSEPVPDIMIVDAESEGDCDGQEVETMLRMTQSCNIAEADALQPADEAKADDRSRSSTREVSDLDGAELQYPGSEEPMDVDSAPGPERESKPPDPEDDRSRKESSSVDEPSPAENAAAATEQPEERTESIRAAASPEDEEGEEKAASVNGEPSEYPTAYIYTFDSLGSRHPRPVNKLAKYLQHEAVDKKNYKIEDTCMATSKQAKAPMQKNFCDCGLFVLAFVEAFMKDPIHSMERIRLSQADWYTGSIENLREVFREKTIALSEAWKKERAEKEGVKDSGASDKGKAKAPEAEVIEDSDDEIIVGDIIPAPAPAKGGNKGGKKGGNTKATRLRG